MNPHIILLGAPGSGKGTQATRMIEEYGFTHISTGELLRSEVKKGTALGKSIQKIIESGKLVEDGIMLELLKSNCDFNKKGYLLDGYPRNIEQAKSLNTLDLVKNKHYALYFDIDIDVIQKRIVNRRSCQACGRIFNLIYDPPSKTGICDSCGGKLMQRSDDTDEVVKNRVEVYKATITPVLNFYRGKNILIEVNASKHPDEVFAELKEKMKKLL